MCGIAALVSVRHEQGVLLGLARRMADAVAHRGPDGEGFATFHGDALTVRLHHGPSTPPQCLGGDLPYSPPRVSDEPGPARVILAHRRLSIVDLSAAGHQPMCFGGERYWLTYNGEIYNHRELRAELEGLGHRFASHSDTEVLLAAYAQWGEQCLARFNGMFSFVLIDRETGRLFAARDRFGVKPLYYWVSPEGFAAFASEIKQFAVLPGWRARAHAQHAYDFLVWGLADHESGTLFEGVAQLRGGEFVHETLDSFAGLSAGAALPVRPWYRLPEATDEAGDFEAAAARFGELLTDSVRLRLRADVPVGSCLSGGLDSSSIVCVARGLLQETGGGHAQKTFTALGGEGRLDEGPYARAVIEATGVDPYFVSPDSGDLFDALDALTWHQDEPFGSTSIFLQWKVFEAAAAERMKVMLDGQGADEALGGYTVYWGSRLAGLARRLRLGSLTGEVGALAQVQGMSAGASVRMLAASLLPASWSESFRGAQATLPDWFGAGGSGILPGNPFTRAAGSYRTSVRSLSRAQLLRINLPLLLHWEDRNSMAHSVEARVPFLDYRLVEYALALPDEYKLSGGWTKRVLRAAMRGILPEKIAQRRDKIGFEAPELEWMRSNPGHFRAAIERAATACGGMIRREQALQQFDGMVAGRIAYSTVPWRMISFGAWAERFAVDCGA